MNVANYTLNILSTTVDKLPGGAHEIVVRYEGKGDPDEVRKTIQATDLNTLITACEELAREIFQKEFRLNAEVNMSFALNDENGLKLWHTKPNLYIKCPLTMTMDWSCSHLRQAHKTMTTLGVIELPDEIPLDGNAVGVEETVSVILDSMATGVEFMGNVMYMRSMVDHETLAKQGVVEES
ncbi:type 2 periplasmic-binding domain-containing protein [Chachezhania sediminis]|uniref:hypothetical protein n=1 Tax=Chachezhania sediminis TaxID=2599291 RepID=UPI00131E5AD2|nr:hypothetical protein [Chachezhania sediminis]